MSGVKPGHPPGKLIPVLWTHVLFMIRIEWLVAGFRHAPLERYTPAHRQTARNRYRHAFGGYFFILLTVYAVNRTCQ